MAECSSWRAAAQCEQLCAAPPRGRPAWQSARRRAPEPDRRRASGGPDGALPTTEAFARASSSATAPGAAGLAGLQDPVRRYRQARLQVPDTGRFEQCPPRGAARRQHERIGSKPQRHGAAGQSAKGHGVTAPRAGAVRRAAPAPRPRFPRSSGGSRRSAANCAWRKAGARRRSPPPPPAWSIYLSSSRWALRPSSRFCRICTIRSGVANRPTISGWLELLDHAAATARPAPAARSPS